MSARAKNTNDFLKIFNYSTKFFVREKIRCRRGLGKTNSIHKADISELYHRWRFNLPSSLCVISLPTLWLLTVIRFIPKWYLNINKKDQNSIKSSADKYDIAYASLFKHFESGSSKTEVRKIYYNSWASLQIFENPKQFIFQIDTYRFFKAGIVLCPNKHIFVLFLDLWKTS